ncbi:hypothetical protein Ctob_001966 [Chrysochromulina tobinii]|uniref:Uncharacterized protein n=1 Tax=Chrysochromulina tobinii TaxID=1460289 RepID=A0A0M0J4E5_9EUKA|nr:hypothetical protein Ctob_001966 [Chrysochromulina tobinii]|eukprot:KOO21113.1 hypothetical protein Ctob_001966 [Chrysochromulina sp. CCMP291]
MSEDLQNTLNTSNSTSALTPSELVRRKTERERPTLAAMVDKLAAKANEKGNAKQAKVLYAASLTLEPTLARRVSMANMMLKSGEADQAQHEYNEILSSGEPLSEKIKTMVERKLGECIYQDMSAAPGLSLAEKLKVASKMRASSPARPAVIVAAPPSNFGAAAEITLAAKQLFDAGQVSNGEGKASEARVLFVASHTLSGAMSARISAANMALKLGGPAALEAASEYEGILSHAGTEQLSSTAEEMKAGAEKAAAEKEVSAADKAAAEKAAAAEAIAQQEAATKLQAAGEPEHDCGGRDGDGGREGGGSGVDTS